MIPQKKVISLHFDIVILPIPPLFADVAGEKPVAVESFHHTSSIDESAEYAATAHENNAAASLV